jgi:beta-galactosidase/beta-glucuronidase
MQVYTGKSDDKSRLPLPTEWTLIAYLHASVYRKIRRQIQAIRFSKHAKWQNTIFLGQNWHEKHALCSLPTTAQQVLPMEYHGANKPLCHPTVLIFNEHFISQKINLQSLCCLSLFDNSPMKVTTS